MHTISSLVQRLAVAGVVCLLLLVPGTAPAQGITAGEGIITDFTRPGQPSMTVYLWGGVGRAGLWRVERDVDLIQLLTAAGVPSIGTDSPGTRRRTSVNVYRLVDGERRQVYAARIEDLLEEGASYPSLNPEDVVEIHVRERRSIGLGLISTLVGTASTVTLLALRLFRGR
jgi:hypothetical protein